MKKLNKKRGLAALMTAVMGVSMFTTTAAIGVSAGGEGAGTSSVSAGGGNEAQSTMCSQLIQYVSKFFKSIGSTVSKGNGKTGKQTAQQRKDEEKKPKRDEEKEAKSKRNEKLNGIKKYIIEEYKRKIDAGFNVGQRPIEKRIIEQKEKLLGAMIDYVRFVETITNGSLRVRETFIKHLFDNDVDVDKLIECLKYIMYNALKSGAPWEKIYSEFCSVVERGLDSEEYFVRSFSEKLKNFKNSMDPKSLLLECDEKVTGDTILKDFLFRRGSDPYSALLDNEIIDILTLQKFADQKA